MYTHDDIIKTEMGEYVPSPSGYRIGHTVYSRKIIFTFKDGIRCNADSEQEALNWMNKLPKKEAKIKNIKEAFSYTTHVAGTTWDPTQGRTPFNVVTGMGFLEDAIKGVHRRDEREAQAPKILPFPLDRIVNELADVYEGLIKTRCTLMVTIRSALLSKEEKAVLHLDIKYVDRCIKTIKQISADIEKVHL